MGTGEEGGYPERRRHDQVAWGERAWANNRQEVEAPWPLTPAQKYTQQINQTPEDTRRRYGKREVEVDTKGKMGHQEHEKKPWNRQGLG